MTARKINTDKQHHKNLNKKTERKRNLSLIETPLIR